MRLWFYLPLVPVALAFGYWFVLFAIAATHRRDAELCRKCGLSKVRPSWPGSKLDKIVALLGFAPYRCAGCRSRFYGFRHLF